MRLGRAAHDWQRVACSDEDWRQAVAALSERAASTATGMALSIYPWDIVTEIETRLESPQAMLLVVPNGKVKLLKRAPVLARRLAPRLSGEGLAGLSRRLAVARGARVRRPVPHHPALLAHANETWAMAAQR
jgi:hypothetical protein